MIKYEYIHHHVFRTDLEPKVFIGKLFIIDENLNKFSEYVFIDNVYFHNGYPMIASCDKYCIDFIHIAPQILEYDNKKIEKINLN